MSENNSDQKLIELQEKTLEYNSSIQKVSNSPLEIKKLEIEAQTHLINVKRFFLKKIYDVEEKILNAEIEVLSIENKLDFSNPKDKPYFTMKLSKASSALKDIRTELRNTKSSCKNETVLASNNVKLIKIKISTIIRTEDFAKYQLTSPIESTEPSESNDNKENGTTGNKKTNTPVKTQSSDDKRHGINELTFTSKLLRQQSIPKQLSYFNAYHGFNISDETASKLTKAFTEKTFNLIIKECANVFNTNEKRVCFILKSSNEFIEFKMSYQPILNELLKANKCSYSASNKSWKINLISMEDQQRIDFVNALSQAFDILIDFDTGSIHKLAVFNISKPQ